MKSGLEGRNNRSSATVLRFSKPVSMKSGLEGRNNLGDLWILVDFAIVSMKSGLEGRNNWTYPQLPHWT